MTGGVSPNFNDVAASKLVRNFKLDGLTDAR